MTPEQETNKSYCAHCGTANEVDAYACDRCGEHIFLPDPMQPPPMGLAECPKCLTSNVSRASYCVKCGSSMVNAARINVLGGSEGGRNAPHARPGGIRISSRSREEVRARASEGRSNERERERRQREESGAADSDTRQERERKDREWARSQAQERKSQQRESESGENDSGTRSARLPRSARGWNTAAFLLGPVWGPANGVWLGVIGLVFLFIPVDVSMRLIMYLAFGALLGIKGNEMAWRAKRWSSVEQFKKIQQQWMLFALIVNIALLIGMATVFSGD